MISGCSNRVLFSNCSFIGSGFANDICFANSAFIGAGQNNVICGGYKSILNGVFNTFAGDNGGYSQILAGACNRVNINCTYSNYHSIINGSCNLICGAVTGTEHSFIAGGSGNSVCSKFSSAFGLCNCVTASFSHAWGCGLTGSSSNTFYVNNLCACGSLYTSAISSGCAVCVTTGGQLIGYTGGGGSGLTFAEVERLISIGI